MAEQAPEPVEVIRADVLAGIPHGFLGRRGGVSTGLVSGLNVGLGSGDDPAAVAENRRRAAAAVLPGARLVTVYQVHSLDCVVAGAWPDADRPHADALVTDRPGLLLGIVTADCAPVLLADRDAGVIGAAHAGWKGAFGGVIENTVAAMARLGAQRERIVAAIGPCIAVASYEVDEAFRARILSGPAGADGHFVAGVRPGHWQFDLEGYVAARLRGTGIAAIEPLGLDTYADPARFFSFRRATHRGEPDYGREIALIGLAERP
ncbi:MAG: peptidoglycan editing factor PgeF [Sphingomonadales bacterium]|nr:peptidoglycan editing factor PgeF [Sphingomonadales bacterium]